ncbi:hypothetical protein DFH07DRAFT_837005 [Mycena maculata]|uniref:Uncharacterized protein n=1 Tax=Mycena maculata TaxID=230809 RepID=A0AAD7IHC2_9AGAR|nr:hypothetical protein DFH07DRAFT_837005 [Mycena maculata]
MIPARSTTSAPNDIHPPSPQHVETVDRLPPSAENVRQNFITTVQAMAVVTTLFAGIQAQLLSGLPSAPSPAASEGIFHALLLVSYGGLAVNVGAALSAMIFLDVAGEAPEAFRRLKTGITSQENQRRFQEAASSGGIASITGLELLVLHGSPRSLQFAWYHCVSSTILGTFLILLQISFLAWINIASQVSSIFVVVVLALFWAALPLPGYLIYNFGVGFIAGLQGEPY